jgi:hypothetical protein
MLIPADESRCQCCPYPFWFSGEYLLWWTRNNSLPSLLTTGSPADALPGALGQPRTQVLFGGDEDSGTHSGGRFQVGYWFSRCLGVDASFFFLGGRSVSFDEPSSGTPLLARPFFDPLSNRDEALPIAIGNNAGEFSAQLRERLWGFDTNLRWALVRAPCMQVCVLAGFRNLDLTESLETVTALEIPSHKRTEPSFEVTSGDRFQTRNFFYGGQVGADVAFFYGRLSLDAVAKVALGATHEVVNIDGGSEVVSSHGLDQTFGLGGLALPSNQGHFDRDIFTVVPEGAVTLGYQVTRRLRATVGYTFLYTSRAVRPGDAIDTTVNPTQMLAGFGRGVMTGPARPSFPGTDSDFWAQGLSFGLQYRY